MDIQFVSDAAGQDQYSRFTFPAYRGLLADSGSIALGLAVEGQPAGLGFARVQAQNPSVAELLSLFVSDGWRGSGLGSRLLAELQGALAARGCRRVTASLTGSADLSLPVERLLRSAKWEFHGPTCTLFQAERETVLQGPWLADARLPAEMTIVPWLELDAGLREELYGRLSRSNSVPENLDPRWNETGIAPCSVGMIYEGKIAGWCIAYWLDSNTVCRWRLWVDPALQRMARAVPLLAETIRRGRIYGISYGVWSVSADNSAMLRLLDRRMKGYLNSAKPVWEVQKAL